MRVIIGVIILTLVVTIIKIAGKKFKVLQKAMNFILLIIGPFSLVTVILLLLHTFLHGTKFAYAGMASIYIVLFSSLLFVAYKYEISSFMAVYICLVLDFSFFFNVLGIKGLNTLNGFLFFVDDMILATVFCIIHYSFIIKGKISEDKFKAHKSVSSLFAVVGTLGLFCTNLYNLVYNAKINPTSSFYSLDSIILYTIYPIQIGIMMTDTLKETKIITSLKDGISEIYSTIKEIREARQKKLHMENKNQLDV